MVGIFSRFSGNKRLNSYALEKKDRQVNERDGAGETHLHGDRRPEGDGEPEFDVDFKPIDHPLEPPDDDRPTRCPIPPSLLPSDEGSWKKPFAASLLERAEALVANDEWTAGRPTIQTDLIVLFRQTSI